MPPRTYLLAAGAFAVGTSAYVVSGVLPAVSGELGVSLTAAGQLATVFALSYAISAPLLATLTGRWERRTLLVVALLVAGAGNALAALATNYPVLLGSRVIAALGAAVYTPAATLFATELIPAAQRGRAVAIVFSGLTFALVVGVPVGSLLGDGIGYRGVFGLVAVVCVAVAVLVRFVLPRMAGFGVIGLRERFAVARHRRVLTVLAMTVLGVVGAMSVYIYVVPLLAATAGLAGGAVGLVLLAYGLGAVLGNMLGGRATDRFGSTRTLLIALIGFVGVIAVFPLIATTAVGAAATMFVWSVFTWSFNPPMQNMLLQLAPEGGLLLALNASAIYFGVGISGVVGGLVISTVGVTVLPAVAAGLGVLVLVLLLSLRRSGATREAAVPVTVR